jgi:hypothetical protein
MGFENSLMNNGLAGMGGYHGVMLMKALDFKYSRSGANAYFEEGVEWSREKCVKLNFWEESELLILIEAYFCS